MRCLVGFLAILLSRNSASGGPAFQGLSDLPGGEFNSMANDVSADGSVIVGSGSSATGYQPVRWVQGGPPQALSTQGVEGWNASAHGVSGNGSVIVGWSSHGAFRWTVSNGITPLNQIWGVANAVSDSGSVIAGSDFQTNATHAAQWSKAGESTSIDGNSLLSEGWGISGDGSTVVGYAIPSKGIQEAFKWSQSDGFVGLGFLNGAVTPNGVANGASKDGSVIVGYSNSADGPQAFRWTKETGMVGLGDLPGGSFDSSAFAVSADGSIVVGAGSPKDIWGAFIWDSLHGMRDLSQVLTNDFGADMDGWKLMAATGISDDGIVIVGYGIDPSGYQEGWVAHIPEPSMISLLGSGVLLCSFGFRRSRHLRTNP